MSLDERRLVFQSQAGDQAAFEQLVRLYQRRVYGIAFGMVRNADDAMDVTQEAFIKLHKHLHRFKGSSSFYTWLYRIVVNLCIDHLRKVGRRQTIEYDDTRAAATDEAYEPGSGVPDPERALGRQQLRETMDAALATLSPNHRAAILMREVEGLSYIEMAEVMRCSKGTVMSRLFHARRNMQRALVELMANSQTDEAAESQSGSVPLEAVLTEQAE